MIVWLVGLSGAGKTTIARELHKQWRQSGSYLEAEVVSDPSGKW